MQTLTKREKTLIYILICFLIVVACWFLLLNPALEKNTSIHSEYNQKTNELITIQKQLKDYEEAPDQLKALEDSYHKIASQYNDILSTDNIDKLLTTKVLACGFRPKSMTIGEVSAVTFQTKETESTEDKDATKTQPTDSVMKQSTINMTLNGDLNKLKKLMQSVDDQAGLEIGDLSYQITSTEKNTISISFILYMIEK